MKISLFTLVIIALSGLIFGSQALAGSFNQRQARQQKRIGDGITNHQLTRLEARRLRHEQRRISRQKEIYSRDGHLTYSQQRRLKRSQDRADRQITRLKQKNRNRSPHKEPFERLWDVPRRYKDPFRIRMR